MRHMVASQSAGFSGLIDRFGRKITYARLSITDRCDLRCIYCMSEGMPFLPRNQLLTLEEIARVGRCLTELGVTRLRITGGEPLIRRNAIWLFKQLGALPALRDLSLTTNGTQLVRDASALKAAGVTRVNISLDSLQPERFQRLTRVGTLSKTLNGISAAIRAGFQRIKLNSVILRQHNHDEVLDLARFAINQGIDISFIEEMPLGINGDRSATYYSSDAIRHDLSQVFELIPTTERSGGPANYYRLAGSNSRIGFISPYSHNFCAECNRIRMTAAGRLLPCLGQAQSIDLRRVMRAHPIDDQRVKTAIRATVMLKPLGHDFTHAIASTLTRHMNMTGG